MKNIIIIIVLLCICNSCKKYLDKKQNSSANVPATLSDMQALLDNAGTMNQQRTPCYGEVSSDDYFITLNGYNALSDANRKYYTWRYYFFGTGNDWSAGYQAIYVSNLVLDLMKNQNRNDINAKQWDNVKGSALFYRSYYFLCLLWNYAKAYDAGSADKDLGIALRTSSDFNVPSVRANNQQCYEKIINDVKQCIELLPDNSVNVMRPSKVAAYGLLARCCLSMRDYDNALLYADSSLQLNHRLMDYNGDADIPSGINANAPFGRFNKEIIFYSEMDLFYGTLYANSNARIDSVLYSQYAMNDLRKIAFCKINSDGYFQFKGNYGLSAYFSGIATDEMYLTRAECFIRTNQLQKGLDDLDTLLNKRYRTGTFRGLSINSMNIALETVLSERRKELLMRGIRWSDIKRLNKESSDIVLKRVTDDGDFTLLPNANYYALPIPDDIVQLTGMPQN